MTSGRWASSRRRSELPADWPARRRACRDRAHGRCECMGDCGRHEGRCLNQGTDADHAGDRDDHDNLQWLCRKPCHEAKTQAEAARGRAWMGARFDDAEPHPAQYTQG